MARVTLLDAIRARRALGAFGLEGDVPASRAVRVAAELLKDPVLRGGLQKATDQLDVAGTREALEEAIRRAEMVAPKALG